MRTSALFYKALFLKDHIDHKLEATAIFYNNPNMAYGPRSCSPYLVREVIDGRAIFRVDIGFLHRGYVTKVLTQDQCHLGLSEIMTVTHVGFLDSGFGVV